MVKLISLAICPFVQRIAAILEGANVPYDVDFIELSNKPQWFLDISPHGQVPVLITDEGTVLFESDAIAEYLFDVYLPSKLSPEEIAQERAWATLASKNYLVQCGAMSSKSKSVYEDKFEPLRTVFEKMNKALHEQSIQATTEMTHLSSAWNVLLHRADIVKRHSKIDMLEGLPYLQNWQAALLDQDWTKKSVPADFEKIFEEMYLHKERYLHHQADEIAELSKQAQSCCG